MLLANGRTGYSIYEGYKNAYEKCGGNKIIALNKFIFSR